MLTLDVLKLSSMKFHAVMQPSLKFMAYIKSCAIFLGPSNIVKNFAEYCLAKDHIIYFDYPPIRETGNKIRLFLAVAQKKWCLNIYAGNKNIKLNRNMGTLKLNKKKTEFGSKPYIIILI